ncbi:class I SAM-dependent methyltransferase [Mesorhizobium sp. A556]
MPDSHSRDSRAHWDGVYTSRSDDNVSWFEASAAISLDLISRHKQAGAASLVDIGGGASRLVDALPAMGMRDISVLDLSSAALDVAKARLGPAADHVNWIAEDVTRWKPAREYDFWHDRAAFHFLIAPEDRAAYLDRLNSAVKRGGHAIIATFAKDGPLQCSGLPVIRYSPKELARTVGPSFQLIEGLHRIHTTPWGSKQAFQFSVLQRQ